jgi:hypothetical protein
MYQINLPLLIIRVSILRTFDRQILPSLGHISLLSYLEAFTDNLRLPFDALNEMQTTILLDLLGKNIDILDKIALLHTLPLLHPYSKINLTCLILLE